MSELMIMALSEAGFPPCGRSVLEGYDVATFNPPPPIDAFRKALTLAGYDEIEVDEESYRRCFSITVPFLHVSQAEMDAVAAKTGRRKLTKPSVTS